MVNLDHHRPHRPYRVLGIEKTDKSITLSLSLNGFEIPNVEVVLLWADENDVLWLRWDDRDRDIKVADFHVWSADFTLNDEPNVTVTIEE